MEGKIRKVVKEKKNNNPWLKYCRRCGGETESKDVKELIDVRGKAVIQIHSVCTVCGQINARRWEDGEETVGKKVAAIEEEKNKVLAAANSGSNIKPESATLQVKKFDRYSTSKKL